MCVCSCYAEQVAGSIWSGFLPSIPLNILAVQLEHMHAHTLTKKKKKNKGKEKKNRDIHEPVPEERPTDAAGEEKSANPPIRSVVRKPQNINFKQTGSGCHSTIVSILSVSVVQEGGEGEWR